MVKVRFIEPSGDVRDLEGAVGQTAMEIAVAAGVDGIEAQCGGALSCATCHVYVASEWADRIPTANDLEADMLGFATSEVRENSRLSCQIKLTEALDGLELEIPG